MSDNLLGYDAWKTHNPRDDYDESDAEDLYDEDVESDEDIEREAYEAARLYEVDKGIGEM